MAEKPEEAKRLAEGWQYAGYRMTIFSNDEEQYAEEHYMGGGKIPFYVNDALKIAGGDVSISDNLICAKLNVIPLQSPVTSTQLPKITEKEKKFLFLQSHTPLPAPLEVLPWSPQSVWDCLVAVFVDQQGLAPEKILYHARTVQDLGID